MARPTRLHMAIVVVGATFAIMLLAALQVALPIILGLWGLATVVLADLVVALVYHHRRVVHVRSRGVARGRPSISLSTMDREAASERKLTATTLFVALLLCLFAVGKTVEGAALVRGMNLPLFVAGDLITVAGALLIGVHFAAYAPRFWRPGEFDTTEDH